MSDRSGIEYVDATINPLGWGCYAPGGSAAEPKRCAYCYAHRAAKRNTRECPECRAFVPHWHPEQLYLMEGWRKPRVILVQSMGDLFGEGVPYKHINQVWTSMEIRGRHTFLALTKSPENIGPWAEQYARGVDPSLIWPDRIWLGTTVTSEADIHRVDKLLETPAAHYWLSLEPLLGDIDISEYLNPGDCGIGGCSYLELSRKPRCDRPDCGEYRRGVDWVVVGAQTGPGAVAPRPDWLKSIAYSTANHMMPLFVTSSLAKHWPGELVQEYPESFKPTDRR